jgi:hypothetical protein
VVANAAAIERDALAVLAVLMGESHGDSPTEAVTGEGTYRIFAPRLVGVAVTEHSGAMTRCLPESNGMTPLHVATAACAMHE